jgi:two-component system response regulator FixJ
MVFLNRMPQLANGCVLLDVSIPGMDGVELLGRMRPMKSRFFVIAATEQANIGFAVRLMKAGAVDLIQKPFSDETIRAAIHSALLRRDQAGSMRRANEVADAYRKVASLSPRERQVLIAIMLGRQSKVIAFELGITSAARGTLRV